LSECKLLRDIKCIARLYELRELKASRCSDAVTSEFVGSLRAARKLVVLDLSYCPNLGDQGLEELAMGCRCLNWIDLTACKQVSEQGVLEVVKCNSSIERLDLALNTELDDHNMSKAIQYLKRLRRIDVSGCLSLWRHLPLALARFCEYIEEISLASIVQLCDDELRSILMRCSRLRSLDISGCHFISPETVLEGLPHVPKLEKLVLNLIPSISDENLATFRKLFPKCSFEHQTRTHVDPNDVSAILRMPGGLGTTMPPRAPSKKTAAKRKSKAA
jgi:hypothetical protein